MPPGRGGEGGEGAEAGGQGMGETSSAEQQPSRQAGGGRVSSRAVRRAGDVSAALGVAEVQRRGRKCEQMQGLGKSRGREQGKSGAKCEGLHICRGREG